MKASSFHLNLLRQNEVLSSSPVRLRIMLPVGATLACAGLLVWWGVLFTQIILAKTQAQGIEDDLTAKNSAHAEAIQKRDLARELRRALDRRAAREVCGSGPPQGPTQGNVHNPAEAAGPHASRAKGPALWPDGKRRDAKARDCRTYD